MSDYTFPPAYFITFSTYGSWVHGDARGSVNRKQNKFDTPKIKPNAQYAKKMHERQKHKQFLLNETKRDTVLQSIVEATQYYNWYLYAAHVRSNHVHILLRTEESSKTVAPKIKSFATKLLKKHHADIPDQKFWTRGKCARCIWNPAFILPTKLYVIEGQG